MKGAVWLQSCTSSSSRGCTPSTFATQLLTVAVSGSSPPASTAIPASIRSGEALRAVIASEASRSAAAEPPSAVSTTAPSVGTAPASAAGCASEACAKTSTSGTVSAGSGSASASASAA
jgi:hypothetical protein